MEEADGGNGGGAPPGPTPVPLPRVVVITTKPMDDPTRPKFAWHKQSCVKDLLRSFKEKEYSLPLPHTMGFLSGKQQRTFDHEETRNTRPLRSTANIKPYIPSSAETPI